MAFCIDQVKDRATTYEIYQLSSAIPEEIPRVPQEFYASEWKGWGDFLGTGNVANRNKAFMSFAEAKAWVREHGIRTQRQLREAISKNELPDGFPSNPNRTYAADWTGWSSFLRED